MIAAMLSFVLGATLLQFAPVLPPMAVVYGALAAILFLWWTFPRVRVLWGLLLGGAWAALFAANILAERLSPDLERQDLQVEGVVVGLPQVRPDSSRWMFEVAGAERNGVPVAVPGRIRLSWYRSAPPLVPGQRWRLKVRLRRPHGFVNPGGFDYEGWLFRQGIGAVGYVRRSPDNRLLDDNPWRAPVDRWRQRLSWWLEQALPDSAGGRMLPALVVGDKGRLNRDDWRLFKRTGTNHLVAISGLHIGIVAGLGFLLVSWGWRWIPSAPLRLPAPTVGYVGALVAATAYAAMAGFSLPTRRALLMLAVMLGGQLLKRHGLSFRGLVVALFVVVAADPLAVLSPGLWLSFGAVAAIFLASLWRAGDGRRWRQWGRIQLAVTLGLAPLLLFFFGETSMVSPLVNLLAVPLFSLVLIPLSLLAVMLQGVVWLGGALLQLDVWLLDMSIRLMQRAADWPMAAWQMAAPPLWVWGALLAAVALLLGPRGMPGRAWSMFLLLPLIAVKPSRPPEGAFRFTLLDVGQGLAAAVETHAHLLLFDTGPRFSRRFDAGSAVLLPFIRHAGWRQVDRLIVSHGDSDHSGGVESLYAGTKVVSLLAGEPESLTAHGARQCLSGMRWTWDGVRFEMLSPDPSMRLSENNRSCVLRVGNREGSVLLPGDIERGAERWLLRAGEPLHADVIVAPHHGSKTSSSPRFVNAVKPQYVLYATGYKNRHGFPRRSVVARWSATGARGLETSVVGAIRFDFAKESIRGPVTAREQQRRYWRDTREKGRY